MLGKKERQPVMIWVVSDRGCVSSGTIHYKVVYSDSETLMVFISTQTQTCVLLCSSWSSRARNFCGSHQWVITGWGSEYPWGCGFPPRRNVFIILCKDSLDNNSLSSEGISIKMEGSIKMPYARIYKLGNFLDYCNHLQNWLFQCGIDRF